VRQLHRQSEHGENSAADHPANSDGNHRPYSKLAVTCIAQMPGVPCSSSHSPVQPRLLLCRPPRFQSRRQSIADNRLGFFQDAAQMIGAPETLRINLVNILGP